MRIRHPYSLDEDMPNPDATVHWGGRREWSEVDDDGTFEVPDDRRGWLDEWAAQHGYDAADLLVDADAEPDEDAATCTEIVERTGEVCGRDLPCPYHS